MKTSLIKFRCSSAEKQIISALARKAGRKVSEYCREQALHGKILANPKLTPEEQKFFRALTLHNASFARIANLIKNRDPQLHHAIEEHLAVSKGLVSYFF